MAAVGACRCGTMRSGGTRELMAGFRAALVLGALAGLVLPTIAAPTDSASKQRNVLFMVGWPSKAPRPRCRMIL